MHLVGLALEVLEEAVHAVPLLGPVSLPVGIAFKDPGAVLGGQVIPGNVGGHAAPACMQHQFSLAVLVGFGLPGLDGTRLQAQPLIGHHQAGVDADHTAKALAGLAGTNR